MSPYTRSFSPSKYYFFFLCNLLSFYFFVSHTPQALLIFTMYNFFSNSLHRVHLENLRRNYAITKLFGDSHQMNANVKLFNRELYKSLCEEPNHGCLN